ncbi:MAG TPA: hypothetical protein VIG24_10780 [Acidimicrobiia bacterium]
MARWGEIKCPRCEELKKAGISDAAIAQARRYYMHVQEGGTLTARDVGRMVEEMEVMQAKLAQQGNLVQAAVAAALREAAEQAEEWGAIVDYPNVYMGGPSRNAQRIAKGFAKEILDLIPDAQAALDRVVAARFGTVRSEVVRLSAEGKMDNETTERLLATIRKGGE